MAQPCMHIHQVSPAVVRKTQPLAVQKGKENGMVLNNSRWASLQEAWGL